MRIAAGVLLIIAALFNLFASLGYLGGGALSTGAGSFSEAAVEAALEDPSYTMTSAQETAVAEDMSGTLKGMGGLLMGTGILLLVSVGVLIAGAFFLFQRKHAKFVIGAGVLALVCEGLGMAISTFGIMNIVGLIGGIMAIVAAQSISNAPVAEEPIAV